MNQLQILLIRADGLMYQAKNGGRNRLVIENADGTRQEVGVWDRIRKLFHTLVIFS